MVKGICKLCLKEKELQKSHYIPSALYANPKTLEFATRESKGIVDEEMRVYLLCDDCEGLFDKNGESEVLRHIAAKSFKRFPLHEKLKAAIPEQRFADIVMFCGNDVDLLPEK